MKKPRHIGIIMDGNGRWAKKRLIPINLGHRAGAKALKALCKEMNKEGFEYLTVYAFSTENWNRPDDEVNSLMLLIEEYLQSYKEEKKNDTMRFLTIGELSALSLNLQQKISYMKEITKNKKGLTLTIAINYGARDEIIRAIKALDIDKNDLTESIFNSYLDTKELPELDLLIRTGGEMRLSNFLLWQSAYSEFYWTDTLWPDFGEKELFEAFKQFSATERRFGKVKDDE
jgi:undecaprenyl diphosphate synthase